jgi:hypothetical protein
MKYMFFKLVHMQARLQRKLRLLTECDDTCNFIIDFIKDCQTNQQAPDYFWRFGVKAAFLKSIVLGVQMEFAIGKNILLTFALPTLVKMSEKFAGIDLASQDSVMRSADFRSYKRVFAKFRRLGYYVAEAEDNYKILLYDELKSADIYDFTTFDAEHPKKVEDATDKSTEASEAPKEGETKEETKKVEAAEFLKEDKKTPTLLEKMDEAREKERKEAESKRDPEVVRKAKFEIDFDKVDLSKM